MHKGYMKKLETFHIQQSDYISTKCQSTASLHSMEAWRQLSNSPKNMNHDLWPKSSLINYRAPITRQETCGITILTN